MEPGRLLETASTSFSVTPRLLIKLITFTIEDPRWPCILTGLCTILSYIAFTSNDLTLLLIADISPVYE
ncbi:hypothetical protein DPMN_130530 [Dreissena polymorpha]|uniref:Uncharacterized protein n=1 Tax=Dreissena polymorpha TaxID=45954 RepID=A0A9D4H327_DREPO|nr:hypothetical protein DPMN_130530 [Dreissena polymorpha]